MIPRLNIIEGGSLFLFFIISCLLIDSVFNPNRLKNPKVAHAVQVIGSKNYMILIAIHFSITLILAIHLSIILSKILILLIILLGLGVNVINSRIISRVKFLENAPNITGVVGGIVLPMFGAFYVIGNVFDLFTISIIIGIAFIYTGLDSFNRTRRDIEIGPEADKNNSIEWEALTVAKELGLPTSRAKEIGMQLYNIRNEKEFNKIPQNQRLLFLPHCLRVADRCKGTYDEEGLHCRHCTKDCKVHQITRQAENWGYKCFIVPGGAMVFNIAKKYQPRAVVAIACLNELREGSSRTEDEYNVPFQVIPLCRDGCVNTDVNLAEVNQILASSDYEINNN